MNRHRTLAIAVLVGTLAVPVSVAAPASASGGGNATIKRGTCSGSAHWKLKGKPDNGRLEIEGEIDSNHNGQTWSWTMRHNGSVSARGTATTKGPSGSFSVTRRMVDLAGKDTIVFRAKNAGSGEVCRGVVSL